MADLLTVKYKQTGKSSNLNEAGMREMQARAYNERTSQYLLLKAPPASGKSRALMFLGLDKIHKQGLKKVIVAVPEMSIGASFKNTNLTDYGFFTDWSVEPKYNLCTPGGETGKVDTFIKFIGDANADIIICTHATLRFAYQRLIPSDFNNTVLAIDEFHHASADGENRLGDLIDGVMMGSDAHIIAMTGSYFRGDAVPILLPEDEEQFTQVTYSYYEQLNGYSHLKSLGIGYHFYTGSYLNALKEVLDTSKKTIIHIPNVNSMESTKDKYNEVGHILDVIGNEVVRDPETGILTIKTHNGESLRVADLVDDNKMRIQVQNYLSKVNHADDVDIIIALGMAKEGFDWPWCEHVLTVGYRSSLTEIVQIIGRATRDCEGKSHAQFTNLIAQPDAEDSDVKTSVNNMLKAITVSLLMEQVLAPSINFKPRSRMSADEEVKPGTVVIEDGTAPVSERLSKILSDVDNITAALLQKNEVVGPASLGGLEPELLLDVEMSKVVEDLYPDLNETEVDIAAKAAYTALATQSSGGLFDESDLPEGAVVMLPDGDSSTDNEESTESDASADIKSKSGKSSESKPNRKFVLINDKFVDIEHLNINLIRQVNPFKGAYEVLSETLDSDALRTVQEAVLTMRSTMTESEAIILWERIEDFNQEHGRPPMLTALDHYENRLALALAFLKKKAQEQANQEYDG